MMPEEKERAELNRQRINRKGTAFALEVISLSILVTLVGIGLYINFG